MEPKDKLQGLKLIAWVITAVTCLAWAIFTAIAIHRLSEAWGW